MAEFTGSSSIHTSPALKPGFSFQSALRMLADDLETIGGRRLIERGEVIALKSEQLPPANSISVRRRDHPLETEKSLLISRPSSGRPDA